MFFPATTQKLVVRPFFVGIGIADGSKLIVAESKIKE